jgi:hypothetical protein
MASAVPLREDDAGPPPHPLLAGTTTDPQVARVVGDPAFAQFAPDAQGRILTQLFGDGVAEWWSRRPPYLPAVVKYAEQFGVDPDLVLRVIKAESSGNPAAVSAKGARGLMQLMPATAKELGVVDPHDPEQNVAGGVRYLSQLLGKYGDASRALAAWNFGPGNVDAGKALPAETRDFQEKVLGPVVRVGGQEYRAGDVVRAGRHAGKKVVSVEEGGVPILSKAAEEAAAPTAGAPAPALPHRRDLRGLLSDPDFQNYSLAERVAALRKVGVPEDFIRDYSGQEAVPERTQGAVPTPAAGPPERQAGEMPYYSVPPVRPEHFDASTLDGRINSLLAVLSAPAVLGPAALAGRAALATPVGRGLATGAAIQGFEHLTGVHVPWWLETAADVASGGTAVRVGGRPLLRSLLRLAMRGR